MAGLPLWLGGVACGMSLVSGFVLGLTSFGSAIVFLMLWNALGLVPGLSDAADLQTGVALVSLMDAPCSIALFAATHTHTHRPRALALGASMLALTPLGAALLSSTDPSILSNALAVLLFTFAIFRGWQMHKSSRETRKSQHQNASTPEPQPDPHLYANMTWKEHWDAQILEDDLCDDASIQAKEKRWIKRMGHRTIVAAGIAGCAAGVFGGMLGVSGPPAMLYFALYPLPPHKLRATFCAAGMLSFPLRLYMYAGPLGLYSIPEGADPVQTILIYIGVIACGGIGLFFGNRAAAGINTEKLLQMLMALLVVASVAMVRPPDSAKAPMLLTIICLCGLAAIYVAVKTVMKRRRNATHSYEVTTLDGRELDDVPMVRISHHGGDKSADIPGTQLADASGAVLLSDG
eukprot:TRINITY_DN6857_c0_g1_i2.p1 TRINITY_DN6857_c0_g1~~TRINITY_DN6857_c0_g1_i2.p1  ORF type:complete len:405 (-),score=68.75 TRINITY_DN6857_c0_g1_i2:35-1249(-)